MPAYARRQSARLAFDRLRSSVDAAVSFRGEAMPCDAPVAPIALIAAAGPCRIDRAARSESRSARQSTAAPAAPDVRAGGRGASPASALACPSVRDSRVFSGSTETAGERRDEVERPCSRAAACASPIDARCAGARCVGGSKRADGDGDGDGTEADSGTSVTMSARLSDRDASGTATSSADSGRRSSASHASP
ncbi:hypothetical protein [Burkholderia thailandensis]|uniref:hypothetical protein n=1 Tax=Burkholderia thailandensis TaxID=57975 RepID=UPI00148EB823|nr:hypothetical protein [Burkholderia thailandensis]MCS6504406.1 hypothetical protein [Burkholderia thailandensis]